MSEGTYEPGVYAKGEDQKVAKTPAQAVDLVFRGYKKVEEQQAPQTPEPVATPRQPRSQKQENPSQ